MRINSLSDALGVNILGKAEVVIDESTPLYDATLTRFPTSS